MENILSSELIICDPFLQVMEVEGPEKAHLVECTIGHSSPIEVLIDSGSDWNLISSEDWVKLRNARREGHVVLYGVKEKPGESARAYGSETPLEALRTFHAWVEAVGSRKPRNFAKFHVVQNGSKSILGRESAIRMQLLQVGMEVGRAQPGVGMMETNAEGGEATEAQADKEEEFPAIPDFIFDFDIDEEVPPSVNAYVNIPEAYRVRAGQRLKKMEAQGIIEKVTEAPRFISGLSAVPKGNDDFRLVVNMTGPNRAIRRRFYKMPSLENIRARLSGARFFTKLDLTSAFHHIRLGERSKELTTFLSPDGMYRFRRLNFGVNSAPEGFQQKMEEILRGVGRVVVYIDDILVHARTIQELRSTTVRVLAALEANNLTLNTDKCEYEKEELEFLGHELSKDGFNIAKKKVEDVAKFRTPRNGLELKSFLGLASFLSAYIKGFADIAKPLWDATAQFQWGQEQQEAFLAMKEAIIGCTTRQGFFNGEDETFLYTDASPWALGAVLTQRNPEGKFRIISFASKLLSPTEQRYPQMQREALGIVWGAEHFWYYLVGRRFTIRTDAQGITFILKRDQTQTKRIMKRSDAWKLRMESFDYSVEYVKGDENIADPSSRLVEGTSLETFEEGPTPGEIMSFTLDEPADMVFTEGRVTVEEVKWHSDRDEEVKAVKEAIESGEWPRTLGKFRAVGHELRVVNGIVTRMGATLVPRDLRPKMLATAHAGHPGALAMKSILKGCAWWPGMLTHAGNWVAACKTCALMSHKNPPMPMQRSRLPAAVWDNIAMDFNGPYRQFGGVYILLIVDLYSRYLIARPVKGTDFATVRGVLVDVFDTFGLVKSCKSDNGPPFNGAEYRAFNAERGIATAFSTPLDAQQNGGVETYMRLVNKGMTAPSVDGGSWKRSLADTMEAHNAAVCPTTGVSPDVLMFGRKVRRNLPVLEATVTRPDEEEIRGRDERTKMRMKETLDGRRSARYTDINIGDKVFVSRQGKAKGQTAFDPTRFTVVDKRHGTFELLSPHGNIISRTMTFIKKAPDQRSTSNQGPPDQGSETQASEAGPDRVEEPDQGEEHDQQRPTVRRSERVRAKPANLSDYVCLLQWQLEENLKL